MDHTKDNIQLGRRLVVFLRCEAEKYAGNDLRRVAEFLDALCAAHTIIVAAYSSDGKQGAMVKVAATQMQHLADEIIAAGGDIPGTRTRTLQ